MMDEDLRTIWCGNLSEKVSEDILYELFMQGGPVQKVSIPKDRDGKQKNFGFVTYKHEQSVPYALDLFEGTALYNRTLNMKSRNNTVEHSPYQQPQYQPQQYQQATTDYDPLQVLQTQAHLRQQIAFQNSMYMMPGGIMYPSQNSAYMQNTVNSRSSGGGSSSRSNNSNSRHNRSHPYRDQYNDRHDKRQDSYNRNSRDQKSYKQSSHRSSRHDNKRKYR